MKEESQQSPSHINKGKANGKRVRILARENWRKRKIDPLTLSVQSVHHNYPTAQVDSWAIKNRVITLHFVFDLH